MRRLVNYEMLREFHQGPILSTEVRHVIARLKCRIGKSCSYAVTALLIYYVGTSRSNRFYPAVNQSYLQRGKKTGSRIR